MRNMLLYKYLLILLSVIYNGVNSAPNSKTDDKPIVITKSGQLVGKITTTLLDKRKFFSFQGIPYGKAPVGPLRFRVSISHKLFPLIILMIE